MPIKQQSYDVLVARTGVKGGDESLEYEDGGEEDSQDARKEKNDGNATKDLEFAFPPTIALSVSRAIFFDAN